VFPALGVFATRLFGPAGSARVVRVLSVMLVLGAAGVVGFVATRPAPPARGATFHPPTATPTPSPTPSPSATPTPPPTTPPPTTKPPTAPGNYTTWALINRRTGELSGSNMAKLAFTESTVKIWLAADFLSRARAAGTPISAADMALLQKMIRLSDDIAADRFFARNGRFASIDRMVKTCHLTETIPDRERQRWSKTEISPRDLARLGLCIADGTATNPTDTAWILDQMRHVGGDGLFGIKFALPPADANVLAIKNGWYNHGFDSRWRVLCLGVHPDWVLAVISTYPSRLGRGYGEKACVDTTRLVLGLTPAATPSP